MVRDKNRCRNCLSAVHFVLCGLERDARNNRCGLDAFGRARFAMAGNETILENFVEWVLHAGEALGGVVVFIVNVDIVVAHGVASFFGEEVVVDEGFCGLARKFHHHAGRRVGIHIGVFACYVGVFCLYDFSEDVGSLGTSCNAALVAVGDVALATSFRGLSMSSTSTIS